MQHLPFTAAVSTSHFRALQASAAKDDTRYYLCGLHVEPVGDYLVRLTATDGLGLVQVTAGTDASAPLDFEPCILTMPRKRVPKTVAQVLVRPHSNGATITYLSKKGKVTHTEELTTVDGIYPDLTRILTTPTGAWPNLSTKGAFRPELVSRVADCFETLGGPAIVYFEGAGDDDYSAFYVRIVGHEDVTCVLCPARR